MASRYVSDRHVYVFMCPSFGAIYLFWTHRAYSVEGQRALGMRAQRENDRQRRWWSSIIGYGGASSWTLTAVIAAGIRSSATT